MAGISRRSFATAGLSGAALIAAGAPLLGGLAEKDDLSFVDPELRAAARAMGSWNQAPLSIDTLPAMRRAMASFARPVLPSVPVARRVIDGPAGAPPLVIYIVNAKAGVKRPGILHMHGGGFVGGRAADSLRDLQGFAIALGCGIVTVDYRLSPETPWPGPVEDNYAGLRWLHDHGSEIGVDPNRIAVMGESAGGGHAALLAITARDRGEIPLAFQCLTYPMLDDRTGSSRPVAAPVGTLTWRADDNRFGWGSFLGRAPGGADVAAAAVPARVRSLSGLPPAWIGVGSIDLFVEEDRDYSRRLAAAGVPAELVVVPGAFHGFDGIAADTSVAKRFNASRLAALRRALSA